MKITILGTRGEIEESSPYHSKQSGVLLNDTLLLDCGEKSFLKYNPSAILITHLHPDHAFFVRRGASIQTEIPIYAPEKYDAVPINVARAPFKINGYTIEPIPTVHSLKVKSQAYAISYKKKRILYTGDLIWIEKKYRHLLKNFDAVITEASFMRRGGMIRRKAETGKIYGHTGVPNLIRMFKDHTNTMIFVHFGAWFYEDMKKARKEFTHLGRMNDIEIIVGYDGLEIEL